MKYYKIGGWAFALTTLCFFLISSASAGVSIYGEGAYTDSDLKVYVYADVTDEPIVSFGVKLTYDANEVSLDEATCLKRNDDVWYFGDPEGGTTYETPNAGPDVTENGASSSVVFVGGKINSTETTQTGVGVGDRILLGIVTFNVEAVIDPLNPPVIGLELGKDGDVVDEPRYHNFVELDGGLLDGDVTIDPPVVEIHERGDANKDGYLNFADMSTIRTMMSAGEESIWADCNDDGYINFADMSCVRTNM